MPVVTSHDDQPDHKILGLGIDSFLRYLAIALVPPSHALVEVTLQEGADETNVLWCFAAAAMPERLYKQTASVD